MSQYKITKKRLAQIIKEEYQNLQELEDPRSPSPMSWEHEGAADDFRNQIMNLVFKLAPLTLDPKTANAVEIEIRDVLNTLNIGTNPRDQYRQEESKKAKKDFDGDGEVESAEAEWKGSRDKAIDKEKEDEKVSKESLDSIRDLIMQELKNL